MNTRNIALFFIVIVLFAGCNTSKPLPEPTAEGQAQMWLWEDRGDNPTCVSADHIELDSSDLKKYILTNVEVIRPLSSGRLFVRAPHGKILGGSGRFVIELNGDKDHAVLMSGIQNGKPFFGTAQQVSQTGEKSPMLMERLWMLRDVHVQESDHAAFLPNPGQWTSSGQSLSGADASLASVISAIP